MTIAVWHDSFLYSVGFEAEDEVADLAIDELDSKTVRSQMGCIVGLVYRKELHKDTPVDVNFVDWKSRINKRVVESSFAGEVHAAVHGYSQANYIRALVCEVYYGKECVLACDSLEQ